jgi:hypothetical protein
MWLTIYTKSKNHIYGLLQAFKLNWDHSQSKLPSFRHLKAFCFAFSSQSILANRMSAFWFLLESVLMFSPSFRTRPSDSPSENSGHCSEMTLPYHSLFAERARIKYPGNPGLMCSETYYIEMSDSICRKFRIWSDFHRDSDDANWQMLFRPVAPAHNARSQGYLHNKSG